MKRISGPAPWLVAGACAFLAVASLLRAFAPPACRLAAADSATEQASPLDDSAAAPETLERERREHLDRLGVEAWRGRGWTGRGVKVAILDTGFRGYAAQRGKALPARLLCRSFRADGQLEARPSQHGVLCAEVIHALAPDAELLFANWEPDHAESFLEAVAWARRQGARVVSCSVIMPSWSDGQGGGATHHALARLLGAGDKADDLFFCACAGNTALRHWHGAGAPDGDGWHCWAADRNENALTPWGQDRVAVELYGAGLPSGRLQVVQRDGGRVVGETVVETGSERHEPVSVRFDPEEGRDYIVKLKLAPAPRRQRFHLVVLGGNLAVAAPRDSIAFPGDGERVVTVAAVDPGGERKSYSSCGPTGPRTKPDFAAVVPFPTALRPQPFSGTSAATPQVAALAALVLARHPEWAPRQVHAFLEKASLDLGAPGVDCETGHGLARLPAP